MKDDDIRRMFFVVGKKYCEEWFELLTMLGLRYGENYIDEYIYIRKSGRKKIAVFYGNCQMHDYFDSINMHSMFLEKYESYYFKYQEYPRWKEDRLEHLLGICDLFVLTQECFDERFRNPLAYIKENSKAKVIKIVTYSFRGYFPQSSPFIQASGEFDIIGEGFNSFHREDKMINKMIIDGYSNSEVIEHINKCRCFEPGKVKNNLEAALKQLEVMDRKSDVKIYDFCKKNYRDKRLFKDPVHMENVLVWYISRSILSMIGIDQEINMPTNEIHHFTQLLIYPEVVKELNLNIKNASEEVIVRLQNGMISLKREEYINRYCDFIRHALAIKNSLHIGAGDKVLEYF